MTFSWPVDQLADPGVQEQCTQPLSFAFDLRAKCYNAFVIHHLDFHDSDLGLEGEALDSAVG